MTSKFILFTALSFVSLFGSFYIFFRFFRGGFKQRPDWPFHPQYIAGMGLFLLASWLILMPVYAYGSDLDQIQTAVTAFNTALQEFTINFGAREILEIAERAYPHMWMQFYLSFFIVASPILTVGALLSLAKDFFTNIRLWFLRFKGSISIFVFSELNAESAALAESIRTEIGGEYQKTLDLPEIKEPEPEKKADGSASGKKAETPDNKENSAPDAQTPTPDKKAELKKKLYRCRVRLREWRINRKTNHFLKKHVLLVFTDVHTTEEEQLAELLGQVNSMGGLTVKKDITRLKLFRRFRSKTYAGIRFGKRSFFIIGKDETENMEHMIRLNEKYRKFRDDSVIVFSSSPTAGYILDTLDKGANTLNPEVAKAIGIPDGKEKVKASDKENAADAPDPDTPNAPGKEKESDKNPVKAYLEQMQEENSRWEARRKAAVREKLDKKYPAAPRKKEEKQEDGAQPQAPAEDKKEPADPQEQKSLSCVDNCYYIRRYDCINELAVRTLKDDDLVGNLFCSDSENRTIRVMIVGLGLYGEAFLKNAFWLYQVYGYDLCISVIDAAESTTLKAKIHRLMPEVAKTLTDDQDTSCLHYSRTEDRDAGECCYDIRIYPSVDCTSPDLEELFRRDKDDAEKDDAYDALCGSQIVLVALGEDEKNIEAAVDLRRRFDRLKGVEIEFAKDEPDESPLIYSVVFDDRTVHNLNSTESKGGIVDHKEEPYHIRFIGQLSDQYNYAHLKALRETESRAVFRHFEWITHEISMCECYHDAANSDNDEMVQYRADIEAYFKEQNKAITEANKRRTAHKRKPKDLKDLGTWTVKEIYGRQTPEGILQSIAQYTSYEYYRNSSIARAIHQDMLAGNLDRYFDSLSTEGHIESKICSCKRCVARKKTEHIRWNAYMRAGGYRYGDRNDRAKVHNDLVPWEQLDVIERHKD